METKEWNLHKYWTVIRKKIWWVMVLFVVITGIGIGMTFYVFTPQYEADTTLLIGKQQASNPAIEYQTIMVNQALVKTYTDIIRSKVIEEAVIRKLGLTLTVQQLDKTIHVVSPDQSQIIQISVMAPNPRFTVDVANTLAQVFQQESASLNINSVKVLDTASLNPTPVKPNKHLDVTLSGALGIIVSLGWVFLMESLDTRFKTEEELVTFLGVPTLGSIPEFR